jgi:hypothetical protein
VVLSWRQLSVALRESDQIPAGTGLWRGRGTGRHRDHRAT